MTSHADPNMGIHPDAGMRRPTRARRGALVLRALALGYPTVVATGCYAYRPLDLHTSPSAVVKLEINDRGRVALGDSLGGSVQFVEGPLRSRNDSLYIVNVSTIGFLNGLTNKWSGEPVAVRTEYVRESRERRLSRSRTFLAAGLAAAGVITFIVTRSILGHGNADSEHGPSEPGGPAS